MAARLVQRAGGTSVNEMNAELAIPARTDIQAEVLMQVRR